MNKQNNKQNSLNKLRGEVEKKYKKRDKRKKRTMKISGGRVRELQRIIKGKYNANAANENNANTTN